MHHNRWIASYLILPLVFAAAGCTTRPGFLPNSDPGLKKTKAEFQADAAGRHYEATAPRGGTADGAAEIDYAVPRISVVNSSPADWTNVEIWVNQQYVIFVPLIPAHAQRAEFLNFGNLFNAQGACLPDDSANAPITSVEMYRGGKMYKLPVQLAD